MGSYLDKMSPYLKEQMETALAFRGKGERARRLHVLKSREIRIYPEDDLDLTGELDNVETDTKEIR